MPPRRDARRTAASRCACRGNRTRIQERTRPMADKSTFTPEEWKPLPHSPQLLSLAIATAGASGIVGTMKEAFSSSASLIEAMKSDNTLLRSLCSREEIGEAQQAMRDIAKESRGGDFEQT